MEFYVFRHTWIGAEEENRNDLLHEALNGNYAFMQYEYGHQERGTVTSNWSIAKRVKVGDAIFLASNNKIYAWGFAKKTKVDDLSKCITLNCQSVIDRKSHNFAGVDFDSSKAYKGFIFFDDCEVFYEELIKADSWGQRVGVYGWSDYNEAGVPTTGIGEEEGSPYTAIRGIRKELATEFVKKLSPEKNENFKF